MIKSKYAKAIWLKEETAKLFNQTTGLIQQAEPTTGTLTADEVVKKLCMNYINGGLKK